MSTELQTVETTQSRPAMPMPSDKFSGESLAHLWGDDNVSVESLHKIASGGVTSFAFCPVDVISSLNRFAAKNVKTVIVWAGKQELADLLGIDEVKPKFVAVLDENGEPRINDKGEPILTPEPSPYKFGVKSGKESKQYATTKNSTNRPLNHDNVKGIKRRALAGQICLNGEGFVFDDVGNAISAQHRAIAYFQAFCENPNLPKIPILVTTGVPAIFADTADTGRSRTDSDILTRDETILAVDTLVDMEGKKLGADALEIRGKMGKELASVLRLVNLRLCGKNVNAGKKLEHGGHYLYDTFDGSLDRIVNLVYNQTTAIGEKKDKISFQSTLGRANLCAAIVLHELANFDSPTVIDGASLVVPEPTEPVFTLDVELWEERLKELSSEISTLSGEGFAIVKQIHVANRNTKQTTQDKFASICFLVSQLGEHKLTGFKPMGSTNFALPAKDSITSKTFPHFGGADIGAWEKPKAD